METKTTEEIVIGADKNNLTQCNKEWFTVDDLPTIVDKIVDKVLVDILKDKYTKMIALEKYCLIEKEITKRTRSEGKDE